MKTSHPRLLHLGRTTQILLRLKISGNGEGEDGGGGGTTVCPPVRVPPIPVIPGEDSTDAPTINPASTHPPTGETDVPSKSP